MPVYSKVYDLNNCYVHLSFRVSSVLNRDVKQFGKKHLLDGDEETCWNSDQVNECESKSCNAYSMCEINSC